MKISDIQEMLTSTGLAFRYHHWTEKEVPDLPFGVWFEVETNNFSADNIVHSEAHDIRVEWYSETRDFADELLIETTLSENEIFWNKDCDWLDDEQCYITIYYLEV